ncbi:hypothetical protein C8T65DRAFT_663950 [Cerioporus squamosus]|nr:hypothetical protein C8T65DRAFT_663950 [Cerioporus squamosus]
MNTHAAGLISLPGLVHPAPGLPPNLLVLRRRVPHLFNAPRHRRRPRQTLDGIQFIHMSASSPLNPTAQAGPARPSSLRDIIAGWIRELQRDYGQHAALQSNIELLRELYQAAGAYTDPSSPEGMGTTLKLNKPQETDYEEIIKLNVLPHVPRLSEQLKDLARALPDVLLALLESVPIDPLTGQTDELYRDELYKFLDGVVTGIRGWNGNSSLSMFGTHSEQLRAQAAFEAEEAEHMANQTTWTDYDNDSGSTGGVFLQQFRSELLVRTQAPPSDATRPQSAPPPSPSPPVPPIASSRPKPASDAGSIGSSGIHESRLQAHSSPRRSLGPLNSNQVARARSHSPKPATSGAANVGPGAIVRKPSGRSSRSNSGSVAADYNGKFARSSQRQRRILTVGCITPALLSTLHLQQQHQQELAQRDAQLAQKEIEIIKLQEEIKRVRETTEAQLASAAALLEKEEKDRARERALLTAQIASLTERVEEGDRDRRELTKELMAALRDSARRKNVA